jgi:4-alpha-glucanotransferase
MEMYRQAYESYKTACENYGMESMDFDYFIQYLTIEQINEFCKKSN